LKNQFGAGLFDKELKDSDEKLRKYRWESKYYDITTDLFQIQKHDLDSLRDQLDSSSNAKENVKRSIYESSEDIAELLKKMTKNVPTKEGPDESIAKISKSKNDQLKDKIPSGTKWADIEITFIDNEYVRIKVKGKVIDPSVHYSQMGFKHKTSPIRIKSWSALKAFALGNGIIPPKYGSDGKLIKTVSIDDIKGLKSKLCDCFGITGSPIPRYDKGKKYNKSEGYKTLFSINEASGLINSISNYHDSD